MTNDYSKEDMPKFRVYKTFYQRKSMKPGSARVMLVDDDREYAEDMLVLLKKSGFAVHVSYDFASAIRRVQDSPPDLILTDKNLGSWRGVEPFLNYLQRERPDIPVVLHSAEDGTQAQRELYCHGFIPKDVPISEIVARLNGVLQRYGTNSMQ